MIKHNIPVPWSHRAFSQLDAVALAVGATSPAVDAVAVGEDSAVAVPGVLPAVVVAVATLVDVVAAVVVGQLLAVGPAGTRVGVEAAAVGWLWEQLLMAVVVAVVVVVHFSAASQEYCSYNKKYVNKKQELRRFLYKQF